MRPPAEPLRAGPAAAGRLAAASSFPAPEPLRLPFELQRSQLFLAAIAAAAAAGAAGAVTMRPLAGIGIVVALAAAAAAALNPRVGLVLLAAVVPVTSGFARGLPVPGLRMSEAVTGVLATVLLLSARRTVRWAALDWLALLYAIGTLALGSYDLLTRAAPFTQSELGVLIGPLQFLLLYRAVLVTARTSEARALVLRLLVLASAPVSLLTLGQQFNVLGARSFVVSLTGTNIYATAGGTPRATGPFPHWHNLGGYLFIVLLVIAALLIRKVPGVLPRWALIAVAALDAVALIQTLSIAPIFGALAGSLIIGVWLGGLSRTLLAIAAVGLIAAILFAPELNARYSEQFARAPGSDRAWYVPQTLQYRYDVWTQDLLPLLKGRYVTGYGPDLPPEIQQFPYTESLYIGLLFRGGIILLVTWVGLAAAIGASALRSRRDPDPLQQAVSATVATAMFVLLFMQLIEAYFLDSGTPHVLWVLIGLLAFRDLGADGVSLADVRGSARVRSVSRAFASLDPTSRALLDLSYRRGLPEGEVVSRLALDADTARGWRTQALRRVATWTRLTPAEVERTLRAGDAA